MTTALLIVVAYLLGTFPSAVLVAGSRGVDITATGSGNPGATNVSRALGWRTGALVFGLDAVKGGLAVGLALVFADRPVGYACGAAAILGHMYPATRPAATRWRGGKGVATGGGVMIVLQPLLSALMAVLWFVVFKLTRRSSAASISIVVAMPIAMAVAGVPAWEIVTVITLGALVLARHWRNIVRLIRREEPALGKNR